MFNRNHLRCHESYQGASDDKYKKILSHSLPTLPETFGVGMEWTAWMSKRKIFVGIFHIILNYTVQKVIAGVEKLMVKQVIVRLFKFVYVNERPSALFPSFFYKLPLFLAEPGRDYQNPKFEPQVCLASVSDL